MNGMRRLLDIKNILINFILIFRYIILDNNIYYEMLCIGILILLYIDICTVILVIILSIVIVICKFLF